MHVQYARTYFGLQKYYNLSNYANFFTKKEYFSTFCNKKRDFLRESLFLDSMIQ